ncbi:MAG: flavin oxidoreductase/NADH oxidase [Clostridia bacterium]|nr:flavin oxidoreductase/NADH oxidase [Clostridia bacterium]
MKHETFHYGTPEELAARAAELGVSIPLSPDTSVLLEGFDLGGRRIANRIAFQAMEGTDGTEKGAPGEMTIRRYDRFSRGGPGVIWFEAVATVPEGRASAHQLWITPDNVGQFHRLTDRMRENCLKENGYEPLIVMQATNSGRYSKPHGYPEPMILYNCPPLEDTPWPKERILKDDDLKRFEAAFGIAAGLAQEAGFDGMDVKSCHRYLVCESLSAFTREGEYGGSYENRTRFIKNAYRAAKANIRGNSFFLSSRLNAYDGFPYPYGFGIQKDSMEPDFTEPIRLIRELREEFHIPLINITMGNPYKNPHVNRPYDHGNYVPDEHPLEGLSRMMNGIRKIHEAIPDLPIIGSAFTYPRQFSANMAAAMVGEGSCALAGFGRMAFAYPDFIRDLKKDGKMDPKKVCITCGGCAVLLRAGTPAGCVIRDREAYKL